LGGRFGASEAAFCTDPIPCLGLIGGPTFKHNEALSLQIATDDQQETDRYWNAIVGNGGQESACGWCKGKWGVSWRITPRVLTEALAAGGGSSRLRLGRYDQPRRCAERVRYARPTNRQLFQQVEHTPVMPINSKKEWPSVSRESVAAQRPHHTADRYAASPNLATQVWGQALTAIALAPIAAKPPCQSSLLLRAERL
jgi:hypothetical protein